MDKILISVIPAEVPGTYSTSNGELLTGKHKLYDPQCTKQVIPLQILKIGICFHVQNIKDINKRDRRSTTLYTENLIIRKHPVLCVLEHPSLGTLICLCSSPFLRRQWPSSKSPYSRELGLCLKNVFYHNLVF